MYRTIADFSKAWDNERSATMKIFNALTDASLSQKVTPEGRSLGFLAWHITTTLGEMMGQAGLAFQAPSDTSSAPASAKTIADEYEKASKALAEAIEKEWNDEALAGEIPMYGENWTRSFTLYALINHQIHHRGQMTVLMRQAGVKVPGIYGPAKEEWSAFGMNAPE